MDIGWNAQVVGTIHEHEITQVVSVISCDLVDRLVFFKLEPTVVKRQCLAQVLVSFAVVKRDS